jgi:hypothetical protein
MQAESIFFVACIAILLLLLNQVRRGGADRRRRTPLRAASNEDAVIKVERLNEAKVNSLRGNGGCLSFLVV